MEQYFLESLLLLGAAVGAIVLFQRLHIPSSLAYLLVGLALGPYTIGPVVDGQSVRTLAEFGIVFLLFTIGLNFALPRIGELRNQVLILGTGQVVLTTAAVAAACFALGLAPAAAFVVGAVFAQSSTTIIGKQLAEQGEEHSRHGRLGVALSVFQDVTAVPFIVVIPVLGTAAGAAGLAAALGWAIAQAVLAFALVLIAGRWLLRPFFHLVAERRSAELFTLTVLFVTLLAAWTTSRLGLSMAFGAFLAGMVLGETEFRHQVESAIRPFRDVLIGLFFIGIGMLIDPALVPQIWHWALAGAALLMLSKVLIVVQLVRWSGIETLTAWRTGLLLAVGGEFGFALLAIALTGGAIDARIGQIALTSVFFSMIAAPFLIRYNHAIAGRLAGRQAARDMHDAPQPTPDVVGALRQHAIICGYGRIGQSVGHVLEEEKIPYIALDLDPARVREAHLAGEPVFYGDAAERGILETAGVRTARLLVISHADVAAARSILAHVRDLRPNLPVMVRTRDETHVEELRAAGAAEVVPETLEAGLMIAVQALLLLDVPLARVLRRVQEQRASRYRLLRESFRGDALAGSTADEGADRLHAILLTQESPAVGRTLAELDLKHVAVTALVRGGVRQLTPPAQTRLEAGDAVVLFGAPQDLGRAEQRLIVKPLP